MVIRKNGKAVVLGENILKPNKREGQDPRGRNLTADNDEGFLSYEANTSSYLIVNGNGDEYLNIGYDETNGKEIKYSSWSDQYGAYFDVELETQNTMYQDSYIRQYMNERYEGEYETSEVLEKSKAHEKCVDARITEVDTIQGNEKKHNHVEENTQGPVEINEAYIEHYAQEILDESDIISSVYNLKDVKLHLKDLLEEKQNKGQIKLEEIPAKMKEIAEELKETMEKQAENEKVLGAGENPAV